MKRARNPEGAIEGRILEFLWTSRECFSSRIARETNTPIGSVFCSLDKMRRERLIEEAPKRDGIQKYWKLTAKGIALANLNRKYVLERQDLDEYYGTETPKVVESPRQEKIVLAPAERWA